MGQELDRLEWREEDFALFVERLKAETDLVEQWERDGALSDGPATGGFELEAWLVDADMQPAPMNAEIIAAAANDLIVPELSRFNIEFNGDPAELTGAALSTLHRGLQATWDHASAVAAEQNLRIAMTGILPTITSAHMRIDNMSASNRYRALDEHVFRLRKGKPIRLTIEGRDRLDDVHRDVMLEAATTSFQMHLKVPPAKAAAYYNAAKLVSAPLVAVSANSPYLFGADLWAESRIPLFEQAVSVGEWDYAERVTFGVRFIEEGLSEVFRANRQRYPILLPILSDAPPETLPHLKLHNGTIWRWNRALVGWDPDSTPHYRLEQRVVPAGPTLTDSIANAAFFYGLITALAEHETPPDKRCQFFTARDNFYACAKAGLDAQVRWDHQDGQPIARRILETLLPMARDGLDRLGIAAGERDYYLGIIEARVARGQNGATWQRRHVAEHSADMASLLAAYLERQESGEPVHMWSI